MITFELVFLISTLVAAAVIAWWVVRDLRSGVLRRGNWACDRSIEPVEYWFHIAYAAAVIVVLPYVGYRQYMALDEAAGSGIMLALFTLTPAFWMVRALQTGVVGISETVQFERWEEPREYWALVGLNAAAVAALGGLLLVIF